MPCCSLGGSQKVRDKESRPSTDVTVICGGVDHPSDFGVKSSVRIHGSQPVCYAVQRKIAAATSSGLSSSAKCPAPGIVTISVRPAIALAKRLA